ncbi:MAG: peroxiredoxin family protein [Planctomycetes bacterium]|nr:peroxiredoxin family protein [Planctomycetota bacterium]
MKRLAFSLLAALCVLVASGFTDAGAASTKRLPTFDMKDLEEREHSLADDKFKDKVLLVAAFGTWQDVSIRQARELQKFHKAHPEVEIIAFVCDELALAREFRTREGLTFPCYKADGSAPIGTSFNRLFETKKGKTLTLNRVPFVLLTDKNLSIEYANLGLTTADQLADELGR